MGEPVTELQGFRLSPQQARLWRRVAADGPAAYAARCRIEIAGPLDLPALERALARLAERWEILRTGFLTPPGLTEPLQVIAAAARPALAQGELADLDRLAPPADLARPPLLAAALARPDAERAVLSLALPALVADEAGLDLLARALARAYAEERGEPAGARGDGEEGEEPLQYADLAEWLRELLESPDTESGRGYWSRQEVAPLGAGDLPLSVPLGAGGELAPARCAVELPAGLAPRLAALARALRADLADLLAAAWGALLARLTGRAEVALAVTFAGRKFAELAGALGPFASRIPVPLALPDDLAFAAAVARAAAALAERRGFEEVFADELLPGGAPPELPFAFARLAAPPRVAADGALFAVASREVVADRFLVELRVDENGAPGDLDLALRYDAGRLAAADAALLAARLVALLAAAAARPETPLGELPVLGAAERERLVRGFNATRSDLGPVCTLHGGFAAQAARTPGRTALESEAGDRTYAQLDAESGALAAALAARGVGRGDVVALCLERSPAMVVAMLATLKAGAAFLPVEPGLPAERRAWMLADARPALALVGEGAPDDLGETSAVPAIDLRTFDFAGGVVGGASGARAAAAEVTAGDLAYVIYTSGSSGRPKGVAVGHGAIANRVLWMQAEYPVDERDAVLQKTPYGFDASLWEIFLPLATGARLVLARPGAHGDVAYLARVVAERGVTVLQLVPSLLGPFLAAEESALCRGRLRRLFCGGEALPAELAARSLERLGVAPVNLYGPTEAAIDAASYSISPAELAAGGAGVVPIGRPIANDRIHLLDEQGRLAPQGAAGELAIGGTGLALGYLGRPDLTAERFVPDPWCGAPGERLYRTGDLARRRADGAIEYLGRIDGQVKIRGVRVELGEVEAALARLPGVVEAAAAVREGASGEPRLAAYVVAAEGARLAPEAVRAQLAAWLPEAMVPSDVVALPALPRLPSGKLDRRSLPAPERGGARAGYVAPRTPTEQVLAERLAALLGIEALGVHDNVFDLGFHSLLATQLGSRLRRTFGVSVPLRSLFELPTVAELAARIDAGLRGDPRLEAPPLRPYPRAEGAAGEPLSFAQRRLWFLDRLQPGSAFYNIPIGLALAGRLDRAGIAGIAASLGEIVRRHESLRTTFAEAGEEPVQRIAPPAGGPLAVPEVDLAALPEPARRAEAARLALAESLRPFDLARGPLLRAVLVRLAAEEHRALFTLHHIVSDGWSTGIVTGELAALYAAQRAGRPSPLPAPELQYADYARWQREWLQGEALAALADFWRRELDGAPPRLALPADRPRPAAATTRGGTRTRLLSPELAGGLARLARAESATPFMVALAAGAALLGWLAGTDDLVLGTDVAGRNRAETEGIVGFFINQLPLRCRLGGDPDFRALVERLRETTLAAYAHQDLPFDKLVELLNPERRRAFAPIFQAKVSLHNMPSPPLELPGLAVAPFAVPRVTAQFDWALNLTPLGDGLQAAIEYSADLFDEPTIDRMLAWLEAVLAAAVERPELRASLAELPLLAPGEREELIAKRKRAAEEVERLAAAGGEAASGRAGAELEEIVAGLFAEVLGRRRVGVEESFFDLGGHSLSATQVVSRMRRALGVELEVRHVFDAPTAAALARAVAQARGGAGAREAPPFERVASDGPLPLSSAQRRLWFLEQLHPGTAMFNIPEAVRLRGELDPAALAAALAGVVARHEPLRARFPERRGEPVQEICPPGPPGRPGDPGEHPLPLVDLAALPADLRETELSRLLAREAALPLDLARGPLLRARLVRCAARDHVLSFTVHHIASDAWSAGIFVRELGLLYAAARRNEPPSLAPLPFRYADFVDWQRRHLQGETLEREMAWWSERLAGAPPLLELPADRPRPARPGERGATRAVLLPAPAADGLRAVARREGATLFMALTAAWLVVLKRLTGREDLVVGTDVANRNRQETEGLIGFFVNQLALRVDLSGDPSFRELVGRVREVALGAYAHQDVSFDAVVDALKLDRHLTYAPLFQVKLFLENASQPASPFPGLAVEPLDVDVRVAKLDLVLAFWDRPEGLHGWVNYSTDLFDAPRVERWLRRLSTVAGHAALAPEAPLSALEEALAAIDREEQAMEKKGLREFSLKSFRALQPKPVALAAPEVVARGYLAPGQRLPLVITPAVPDADLAEWSAAHAAEIEADLLAHGAILFRGFGIDTPEALERFAGTLCDELFNENGEHPRESVSGNVYTPVFYPQDQRLLWHNENSFNWQWPRKIFFACAQPAEQGGETPLVDSRRVYEEVPAEVRAAFEAKGVLYQRTYAAGLGLPWQTVFQTEDPAEVEREAAATHFEVDWRDGDRLRTRGRRPAVIPHPRTGEPTWFNQGQHWHVACLDPETGKSMRSLFADDDLPRHLFFGDGSPIPDGHMEAILDAYRRLEVVFPWQRGDVVLVDNVLVAHGRNPFAGSRKILVAMGEMTSYDDVGGAR